MGETESREEQKCPPGVQGVRSTLADGVGGVGWVWLVCETVTVPPVAEALIVVTDGPHLFGQDGVGGIGVAGTESGTNKALAL